MEVVRERDVEVLELLAESLLPLTTARVHVYL